MNSTILLRNKQKRASVELRPADVALGLASLVKVYRMIVKDGKVECGKLLRVE